MCYWKIRVSPDRRVIFTIDDLRLEDSGTSCAYDYVEVSLSLSVFIYSCLLPFYCHLMYISLTCFSSLAKFKYVLPSIINLKIVAEGGVPYNRYCTPIT